jgi:hypothetical protein
MCKGAKEDSGWSAHSSNILRSAASTAFGLINSDARMGLVESAAEFSAMRPGKAVSSTGNRGAGDRGHAQGDLRW